MKRYAVFVMESYYPAGGWSDLRGLCDTKDEAIKMAIASFGDWYQIVDLVEGKEIEEQTCLLQET